MGKLNVEFVEGEKVGGTAKESVGDVLLLPYP